jgi:lysyl-tRNA synthetase class 2
MAQDYLPTAPLQTLKIRADLSRRIRRFFEDRGFLEVETPLLSADTVIDRFIDPIQVTLLDDPREPNRGRTMWLQSSPEFGMKRLLAAGATAIYQFARAFRAAERGPLHNPEFTIVEWYRVGDDMFAAIDLLAELTKHLLACEKVERLSYGDAFKKYGEINPHRCDVNSLRQTARQREIFVPEDNRKLDRDEWLDVLLVELVQPHLGRECPVILYDFPASQAALAKVRDGEPPLAERFELFVNGIELANGYHELLDADELRNRNRKHNFARAADDKPRLPEESQLLSAMDAGLPQCSGVALGFDRLVMVAAGATNIDDVLAFPVERA